jgi:predicted ATP-binding protein involved in virulence
MQIKQISVTGLFGIFDHVISLNMDERITIVHGPNGFGKTTILRLLNGLFNFNYSLLNEISFDAFRVDFDNNSSVEIIKKSDISDKSNKENNLTLKIYSSNANPNTLVFDSKRNDVYISTADIIVKRVPELKHVSDNNWEYRGESLTSFDVLNRFGDLLPLPISEVRDGAHYQLKNLTSKVHVRLVESQRLLDFANDVKSSDRNGLEITSTVSAYSNELAEIMRSKFTEYGVISQSLDRTFPTRLVRQKSSSHSTEDQLRNRLHELESNRSSLVEVGLLDKDENPDFQIEPHDSFNENIRDILSVYFDDVEKKLGVFNEIAKKIDLLKRIINNKFSYSYKRISFDKEKGFVFKQLYNPSSSHLKTLSPMDLSSGEQHELVLLYELLFKVKPKSLVLIDEPELSLHVGWQVQFLKDLQEITKLADVDILMATHSPDIIQDRWDLTVELKGPGK